jgi:hypothetical protein
MYLSCLVLKIQTSSTLSHALPAFLVSVSGSLVNASYCVCLSLCLSFLSHRVEFTGSACLRSRWGLYDDWYQCVVSSSASCGQLSVCRTNPPYLYQKVLCYVSCGFYRVIRGAEYPRASSAGLANVLELYFRFVCHSTGTVWGYLYLSSFVIEYYIFQLLSKLWSYSILRVTYYFQFSK